MKRAKTSGIIFLALLMICLLALALVACNEGGKTNIPSVPDSDDDTTLPAHEHDYIFVEAQEPSCTENGWIDYYTCDCGKFFDLDKQEITEEQTVDPAYGHTIGDEWIEESSATCTKKAHYYKECVYCGYHMAEEDRGELLPHNMSDWIEDTPATCKAKGLKHKECTVCHTHLAEEETDMLEHEIGDGLMTARLLAR